MYRLLLLNFVFGLLSLTATAQDAVIQRSSTGSPIRRQGTIVDWKGLTVELEQSGRVKAIDGEQVISIETQWPSRYQQGLKEHSDRRFPAAIESLKHALLTEPRPWAQSIIASQLLRSQLAIEDLPAAAKTFFRIIAQDPQSRFVSLCPLRWTGNQTTMNRNAKDWIESDEPVVQLLGASWLIGTDERLARPVLESLTQDIDPSVAGLAVGQLWNARQTKMTAAEIDVWIQKIDTMPVAVTAGPRLAIAAAQERSGFTNAAIASYMRIVILHPNQALVRPAALFRSAQLLHNTNRSEAGERLIAELYNDYPATGWASRNLVPLRN